MRNLYDYSILMLALWLAGCAGRSPEMRAGLQYFSRNELEEALPHFESEAAAHPEDAQALAYVAETLRRLGRPEEAFERAERSLAADPSQSFAHDVLSCLYNPMYRQGGGREDAEKSWEHCRAGCKAEPGDGNIWVTAWPLAISRGDREIEHEAIRRLGKTGFFTPAALEFARWMLRDLPPDALLIVNGDMDTYPPLVVQDAEGLRTDVAIVNRSLLNAEWYPPYVAERYGLPLPAEPFVHQPGPDGSVTTSSDQQLRWWIERSDGGELRRPLAFAATISAHRFLDDTDRLILRGS